MSEALEIAHGPFGRVALLDMDRSLVRHAHPHCHVLFKAEGDDTQFLVGDRLVALTDDQAVLVNAWEPHAYVHDPNRERALILALYIEPSWLRLFRPAWAASAAPGFFAEPACAITPAIRRCARDLAAEMVYDPGSPLIQNELLSGLMVAALERFTAWRRGGISLRDAAERGRTDYRVRHAIAKMRNTPGQIVGIDTLAHDAGLSRAHFYRLFQQSTGVSPNVFCNAIRIERAVSDIVTGRESLADIGAGLGFASPAHFSRFFRDHTGVPPGIFRSTAARNATSTHRVA